MTPACVTVHVYEVPDTVLLKLTPGPVPPQSSGVAFEGVATGFGRTVIVALNVAPVQDAVVGVTV